MLVSGRTNLTIERMLDKVYKIAKRRGLITRKNEA